MLHQRGHARSKADYYPQHLFLRMLNHTLAADDDADGAGAESISSLPRSASPAHMGADDEDADAAEDEDEDSEYQLGKAAAGLPDDEKTVFGSASASRFSTFRDPLRGRAPAPASAPAGLRRRLGGRDVEAQPAVAQRFGGIEEDTKAQKNARNRRLLRELKRGDRVNVRIHPLCLFLFKDGTVISIHKGVCACARRGGSGC